MRSGLLQPIAEGGLVTESPLRRGENGSTERLHELPNVLRVRAEVGSRVMIEINQVTVVLHCVRWQLCHRWGLEGLPSTAVSIDWPVLERARSASIFWES